MIALRRPAEKAARLRRHRGIHGYTDTTPIAHHVRDLLAAGWTRQQIATHADVHQRTIYGLLHNERPGMQLPTAARILALRPGNTPGLVSATGTARRLQALAAMGWAVTWTARQIGAPGATLRELANHGHARVNRAVAEAVTAVFDERCMRPGPSVYSRTIAARNGWVTAVAWDDIDDLGAKPRGVRKDDRARRGAAA